MYQLEKRLEKLHYSIDDFNPTSEKKNEDLDYIDRFLEKIKTITQQLFQKII